MRSIRPLAGAGLVSGVIAMLLMPITGRASCQPGHAILPACSASDPKSPCNVPQGPDPRANQCNATGSPVYVGPGIFTRSATDLSLLGDGFPVEVYRVYHGSNFRQGPFGRGWSTSIPSPRNAILGMAVAGTTGGGTFEVTDSVHVRLHDGRAYDFMNPSISTGGQLTYEAPVGRHDTLVAQPDQSLDFTLEHSRSVFHYDAQGRLQTMTDDYGNTVTYHYTNDKVDRITNGSGRFLDITWSGGRIIAISDGVRGVAYGYYGPADGPKEGMLATVTDPVGRVTYYDYDVTYSILSNGPPEVRGIRFAPLLKSVTDHWGRVIVSASYDTLGRVVTYSEMGKTFTYQYPPADPDYPPGRVMKLSSNTSDVATTFYVSSLDDGGLINSAQEGTAPAEQMSYAGDGQIANYTDEASVGSQFSYTPDGYLTDASFGNGLVHYKLARDAASPWRVTEALPVKADGSYDPKWQAYRMDYYAGDAPATGAKIGALSTLYQVHNVPATAGGATLKTDLLATFKYDTRGHITAATNAAGGVTTMVYDGFGNLTDLYKPANNDSALRPHYQFTYDDVGRVIGVTDALGHTATYEYDHAGRLRFITLPKPSPAFSGAFKTTIDYDLTEAAHPSLVITRITDPNGKITRRGYDQWDRLVVVIDAKGAVTRLGYRDELLERITDANGNVTRYEYDGRKRLKKTIFPDGQEETYTYRPDGLLETKFDRRQINNRYEYDALKRLTRRTNGVDDTRYFYGTEIAGAAPGQNLTRVDDVRCANPAQTCEGANVVTESHLFAYDSAFRLSDTTQGPRGSIHYDYNPDNTLADYIVNGGARADYTYYDDHSLKTIAWNRIASGVFRYDYNLNGQYTQIAFPNGQRRQFLYDDQGRLTTLANLAPGGANLATYAYGYDINHLTGLNTMLGQRTSMTANVPAQGLVDALTKYAYDDDYQLVRAEYPSAAPYNGAVHEWSYDAIGNRLSETVNGGAPTSYAYAPNPTVAPATTPSVGQKLSAWGDSAYTTYDGNGNPTAWNDHGTSRTMSWSFDNTLASVGGADGVSYAYDFSGRRTSITKSAQTTADLYNGFDLVAQTGPNAAEFLFGPGIDQPLAMASGGDVRYYGVDGLGSITGLADPAGSLTASTQFDAWGRIMAQSGAGANPFGYTGREFADAGMDFYRARYYNPGVGRFMSEDPIGFSAGINFYSYSTGNPVDYIDPTGTDITITQDRDGTINVYADITIYGEHASSGLADVWKQDIESYWNGHSYQGCRINYSVNVVADSKHNNFITAQPQFSNLVYVVPDRHYRSSVWGTWKGSWSMYGDSSEIGHEAGHLFGLDDDYRDHKYYLFGPFYPYPGHEGHLMSELGPVAQDEIDRIFSRNPNFKGRACTCPRR